MSVALAVLVAATAVSFELPLSRHGVKPDERARLITIESGEIRVDGIFAGTTDALSREGAEVFERTLGRREDGQGRILVAAEPATRFGTVREVVRRAKAAGHTHVGFAVRSKARGRVLQMPPFRFRASPSGSTQTGTLAPALIDGIIKKHLMSIQRCYEKELPSSPGLHGKIVVNFRIESDGGVSMARTKSTTMNNRAVEDCVNARFLEIRFPEPEGGGIVTVIYPLLFKTSD